MRQRRASAAILLAHLVVLLVTAWSTAIGPKPIARGPLRLEPAHTVALAPAKPLVVEDFARRPPPPLAVPSSMHPLRVPPAPLGERLCSSWAVGRPTSTHLLLATARGPPQAT